VSLMPENFGEILFPERFSSDLHGPF
jgi:hypothetical protein